MTRTRFLLNLLLYTSGVCGAILLLLAKDGGRPSLLWTGVGMAGVCLVCRACLDHGEHLARWE